jgi:type I restriction enzyme M protein
MQDLGSKIINGNVMTTKKVLVASGNNEKATDQFVRDLLRDIGVTKPWEQDGGPKWKRDALAGGSKSKIGKGEGKPEFVFVTDD